MKAPCIEGIILRAIKYQDYDQILTVFSAEEGVISLFVKGAFSRKNGQGSMTAPLSRVEFICTKGKNDLYLCKEISMLAPHLHLRQDLSKLEAALELSQAIYVSQMPHKPSPDLYRLLAYFLEKIEFLEHPRILVASFMLKILRHDGLFGLTFDCAECGALLTELFVASGECYCSRHASPDAIVLSQEEASLIDQLAFGRSFSQLAVLAVPEELIHKVKLMFQESWRG